MPSLRELANNVANHPYYSGVGNFRANRLPFGQDRPGGGSSNEPFIKTKIGFSWSAGFETTNSLVRNGLVSRITHTGADVLRLTKFMYSTQRGAEFLAKQTSLQLMNPRLPQIGDIKNDAGERVEFGTIGNGNLGQRINSIISNTKGYLGAKLGDTRIFNQGVNTLAQTSLSGIGRVTRHGMSPFGSRYSYENVVRQQVLDDDGSERLLVLKDRFVRNDSQGKVLISEYVGGPNSFLGIGKTRIEALSLTEMNTLRTSTRTFSSNEKLRGLYNGFVPIETYEISEQIKKDPNYFRNNDFRKFKKTLPFFNFLDNSPFGISKIKLDDYSETNIHKRIGVIQSRNAINYRDADVKNDLLNMTSIFRWNAGGGLGGIKDEGVIDMNGKEITEANGRDLVNFRIKVINNDNPSQADYLIFRAFFVGEIVDDIVAKFNKYTYVGRGEIFNKYESFTNTLSFTFNVVAFSRKEMRPLYQKLNYLKNSLMPDYKTDKLRGSIHSLTIGDYIYSQPGIIERLSISIPEEANWEIALNEPEIPGPGTGDDDKAMNILPMMVRVSMTFTPIYNFLPRRGIQVPVIAINDEEASNGSPDANSFKNWTRDVRKFLPKK